MIFDCEGDSLWPTKFHVLSYWDEEKKAIISLTTHKDMKQWLLKQTLLIGHNIILWDIPQLERVLNIQIKARLIDTLSLSWYLFPERNLHGLESWGDDLKIPKPIIYNWQNQKLEDYIHRCETDVKINLKLWQKQSFYLKALYNNSKKPVEKLPIIYYLSFKMDCAREAERSKWKLDKNKTTKLLRELEAEKKIKVEALKGVMPQVVVWEWKKRPEKPFKKDGTWSVVGAKWFGLLKKEKLPEDFNDRIRVVKDWKQPNPNSSQQVKDWLFSLGWEPETFDFKKDDNGNERMVPQLKAKNSSELCPSVLRLVDDNPDLAHYAGLSILNHRISILKGFLSNVDSEGFLRAQIQGLTNTLRFRHKIIVNLPGVDKPYGQDIRGCLIAREEYELVGSDMSSLEDKTKRHFMYDYDPEYVEEMSAPDFDPHLDLAIRAGAVSEDDVTAYKLYKDDEVTSSNVLPIIKHVKGIRSSYKVVNYSAIYGVGAKKLARELRQSVSFAQSLLDAYWARNWSVKKLAEDQVVKTIFGQMWLFNPVSKFYYSLRYDKDKFSTLNQGTGVYCFDMWIKEFRKVRPQITGQMHDEVILETKKGNRERIIKLLKDAIQRVNNILKLNVELDIDIKFGDNYAEIH